jgi:hypothetical protein
MRIIPRSRYLLVGILPALAAIFAAAQSASSTNPVDIVQKKITAYLTSLADLHCTESVTQEKIAPNGHVADTERAKYDYLIMMGGSGDDFQLNETRLSTAKNAPKPTPVPMLVSNGVPTVLLVFHPYYRDSFKFEAGAEEMVDGRALTPIHFQHIEGRRTPAALALRGREYPLELRGTAWLDKQAGEVVKIDADLERDMSDIGLRSLHLHVDYKPEKIGNSVSSLNLPALAVVDVTTPRQHWRNTHTFDAYKSFSIDVEQDPNVKIRAAAAEGASDKGDSSFVDPSKVKENP